MKNIRKIIGLLLALALVFTMGLSAFAAGETGTITIKGNDNVPITGKTFKAYKLLDVTLANGNNAVDGIAYSVPEALADFYASEFGLDKNAADFDTQVTANISAESFDLQDFAKRALAAAKTAGITATGGTQEDDNYIISNLPLGYYVIEDEGAATPISALALTTTARNAEVDIKANRSTPQKTVGENNESSNNAAIGDAVSFKISGKIPDMTGYKKYYFVLKDNMSKGFTFNNDVSVSIDGTELTKGSDFTVKTVAQEDGATLIEVVLKNFIQYKALAGKDIVIAYTATLNENAIIGAEGNLNRATFVYSNNPNAVEEAEPDEPDYPGPESPVGETPASETRTYVTGIRITKVNVNGETLTGAVFGLTGTRLNTVLISEETFVEDPDGTYYKYDDGTYATTPQSEDAIHKITYKKTVISKVVQKSEDVSYEGTVDSNGILTFGGLSAGEYEIKEIKAPSGYNLIKTPIKVKIDWAAPTAPSTDCVWSAIVDGNTVNFTDMAEVRIVNETGNELPSTGGIGTTVLYIIGAVLVIGAGVLLVAKKRMSAEK